MLIAIVTYVDLFAFFSYHLSYFGRAFQQVFIQNMADYPKVKSTSFRKGLQQKYVLKRTKITNENLPPGKCNTSAVG